MPGAATAPALILVGISMLGQLTHLDPHDRLTLVPAALAAVVMPLTFSIANGISAGILAWVVLHVAAGRWRSVHPLMAALAGLLVARYTWMAAG